MQAIIPEYRTRYARSRKKYGEGSGDDFPIKTAENGI
jgi:hypothetical protein